MRQEEWAEEEQQDICDIYRVLEDSGVSRIDANDALNIDLAEHEGWPPVRISSNNTEHLKRRLRNN